MYYFIGKVLTSDLGMGNSKGLLEMSLDEYKTLMSVNGKPPIYIILSQSD